MRLLRHQLRPCLANRVCFVGVGNPRLGDAAAGVRVVEALADYENTSESGPADANAALQANLEATPSDPPETATTLSLLRAETDPQRILSDIVRGDYDHVVFMDALDFGGTPGDVTVMTGHEISGRSYPSSTPSGTLDTLTQRVEANGHTKSWILGIQPASLRPDRPLSRSVQCTVQALVNLLWEELRAAKAVS